MGQGINDKESFSILRNILPRHSKKIVHLRFCVFQTKSNKAVNNFCRLIMDQKCTNDIRF